MLVQAAAAFALLAACGSGSTTASPTITVTATPTPAAFATPAEATAVSAGQATVLPATTPPPETTPTPMVAPPGTVPAVTLADNGGTLQLAPGQEFVLALGTGFDWRVTVADPSIVSRLAEATAAGTQGLFRAERPGQTELTASGDPACRRTTPACAAPSLLFRLTVVVG